MSDTAPKKKTQSKRPSKASERIAKIEEDARNYKKEQQELAQKAKDASRRVEKLEAELQAYDEPESITDANLKRVAALSVLGMKPPSIATELGIKRTTVNYILNTNKCKKLIDEANESAISEAKRIIKRDLAKIAPDFIKTIVKGLKKHDIRAAMLYAKLMGVEEDPGKGSGNLTVVLPTNVPTPDQSKPDIILPTGDISKDGDD